MFTQIAKGKDEFRGPEGAMRLRAELERIRNQKETDDSVTKAMQDFASKIKVLQDYFYSVVLLPVMQVMGPIIDSIITAFQNNQGPFKGMIDGIVSQVTNISVWIKANTDTIVGWITRGINITIQIVEMAGSLVGFIVSYWPVIVGIGKVLAAVAIAASILFVICTIAGVAMTLFTMPLTAVVIAFVALTLAIWGAIEWIASFIPGMSAPSKPSFSLPTVGSSLPSISGLAPEAAPGTSSSPTPSAGTTGITPPSFSPAGGTTEVTSNQLSGKLDTVIGYLRNISQTNKQIVVNG